MKILLDAFGGDNAPREIILGGMQAVERESGFELALVGKKDVIDKILCEENYTGDRISVVEANEIITCEEEPTLAMRKKPDSTLAVAFKTLKEDDEAKAFVSAGSTGAVLVGATLKLGRMSGVNRPALCPILPTAINGKNVFLLDAGANADCKPINLVQFAVMGACYAKACGVENPKVALLSNGTEDKKGNALTHEAFVALKDCKDINFVGNTEARDLLSGDYDVIVADGFSGNVALKSMEGAISVLLALIKEQVYGSFKGKIGGMLLKDGFTKIKNRLDYNKYGGALFLGVKKIVVKAHGSSKKDAVKAAVLQAYSAVKSGLSESMENALSFTAENQSDSIN